MTKLFGLASFTLAAIFVAPAQAVVVTPISEATSTVILTLNNTNNSSVGVKGPLDMSIGSGNTSASGSTDFGPPPSAYAFASVSGSAQTTAYVYEQHFFRVVGSSSGPIPLNIQASGSVSPTAVSSNSAQLYLGSPQGAMLIGSACQGPANNCFGISNQSSFSVNYQLLANLNTEYNLQMTVFAVANTLVSGPGNVQSTAFIDPFISIDPVFLSSHPDVSLQFSLGITNGIGAVPEPSTWAMMILGFAAVGYMAHRGRNQAAALAMS
jgi:hypothetical protein